MTQGGSVLNKDLNKTERLKSITRRHFFKEAGYGIGSLALGSLLNETLFAASADAQSAIRPDGRPYGRNPQSAIRNLHPHFPAKAKNVIFLSMAGAPSQLDIFDPKPKLVQYNGQKCPEEIIKGERFAFIKGIPTLLGA